MTDPANVHTALTILIGALGGEGGGVLAQWLVETATAAGYPAQGTSIPGVAQRTGATTYYVEIFPVPMAALRGRKPVLSLLPVQGCVDLAIASELLEAGRIVQNGMVSSERTLLVTSTSRTLTTLEKMALGDGRFDKERLLAVARTNSRALITFDMDAATRDAGTVVSAVMLGAIAASGLLPMTRETFENTIRGSGRGADASLRGFAKAWEEVARQVAGAPAGVSTPTGSRAEARPTSTVGVAARPPSAGGVAARPTSAGGVAARPTSAGGVEARPTSAGGVAARPTSTVGVALIAESPPNLVGRASARLPHQPSSSAALSPDPQHEAAAGPHAQRPPDSSGAAAGDPLHAFHPPVRDIVALGYERLVAFQDRDYATLYLQRLHAVQVAEQSADPPDAHHFAMTRETARFLALWMAFDDVVRVAHLKCRASRFARVRREVAADAGDVVHIVDYFKPGIPEMAALLPPWLARRMARWDASRQRQGRPPMALALHVRADTVFGFLALRTLSSLKGLRRRGQRYMQEQVLIERWLAAIVHAARSDWHVANEIALGGRLIKGYGATNERGKRNLEHILTHLADGGAFATAIDRAAAIRRAREAALADDAGRAFDQSLAASGAPMRPVAAHPIRWTRKPAVQASVGSGR